MVKKEIAVHLLAYNLVRAVMAQAASLGHVLPRQLSFKATLQMVRAFEENLRHAPRRQLTLCRAYLLATESHDCGCRIDPTGSNLAPSSDEPNHDHS